MNLTPSEELLYSAPRIVTYSRGQPLATGSGFFYRIAVSSTMHSDWLITNKHVLEGADRIDLHLHLAVTGETRPSGLSHVWQINDVPEALMHPTVDVDLCAFPVTDLTLQAHALNRPIFYTCHTAASIPSPEIWESLDAIEDIVMIGCPNGLYDNVNNLPIVRSGRTATHPARRFRGRDEFMIDLACYPGSSGSSVFLHSSAPVFDRAAGTYSLGQIRRYLLGILYAGPTISQQGTIQLSQQPTFSVSSMMHLGQVIRSTALLDFHALARQAATDAGAVLD